MNMSQAKPNLSKSRLISAWQCPKRLYLEKFRPELAEITDDMEALFAMGHEVGAIAQATLWHARVGRDPVWPEDG